MRKKDKTQKKRLATRRRRRRLQEAVNKQHQKVIVNRVIGLLRQALNKSVQHEDRPELIKKAKRLAHRHGIVICF